MSKSNGPSGPGRNGEVAELPSRTLNFPVFDADNHMYETKDAFTRHLPPEFAGLIKYVEVEGRTKIAVRNVISDYIPNPTFEVVAAPGAQEEYYKEGKSRREILGRPMRALPAFRDPMERIKVMDELGLDGALMWPTLASLLEERLSDDPIATHVVIHALNQWMHDEWTFNYHDRIFATPVISLGILEEAMKELGEMLPFKGRSAFAQVMTHFSRPVIDSVTSLITHGLCSQFPTLRFAPVENGSGWVRPLIEALEQTHFMSPKDFDEDPVEVFKRNIYVHPFHEEDTVGLCHLIGADRVLFGSDWPHPEGMADPITFVDELKDLPDEDVRKAMGGNLSRLLRVGQAA